MHIYIYIYIVQSLPLNATIQSKTFNEAVSFDGHLHVSLAMNRTRKQPEEH
jgi:hypothetical protein